MANEMKPVGREGEKMERGNEVVGLGLFEMFYGFGDVFLSFL